MMWDAPWSFRISWPDHAFIYTNYEANLQIMRRDLVTGAQRIVFQSPDWVASPSNLCVNAGTAYLVASPSRAPSTQALLAVDIASGKVTVLRKLSFFLPTMTYGCSVSPDNSKLLVPIVQRDQSDIYTAPLN